MDDSLKDNPQEIRRALPLLAAAASCAPAAPGPVAGATEPELVYPPARIVDLVDVLHGIEVPDPYRWLEDPDSPETVAWVEAENRVTQGYLARIPEREGIRQRLKELWNYEKYDVPTKAGDRYFFAKNDGLQNQSVIYFLDRLDGTPQRVIDPNTLSADGTVALTAYSVSDDGQLIAYGLSSGGSDWEEWRVRDVESGRDLPDLLRWVKFSTTAWTHDNQGFFYSRYDEPKPSDPQEQANYFQKLYYHRIGTPQSEDRLIYERPDAKEWGFLAQVTEDGRYLIIQVWRGTDIENGIFYQDLAEPGSPVRELLGHFDASYSFLGNDGPVFWFLTNLDAPRRRVVEVDTRRPGRAHWREAVPQQPETLEEVSVFADTFLASYLQDAHSQVRVFDLEGRPLREVEFPGLGSVAGFTGRRTDRETFYLFTSFTTPPTVYHYNLVTGESTLFRQPQVAFDLAGYETRQVFYTSRDGTRVPMFLTSRKDLPRDGQNPVLLYGYGGFNVSVTPSFAISTLVWMEMGGIYAVPNLRGGGEYGEDWHQAGSKLSKENVFDDLVAAAQWLIDHGYTRTERLAVSGRSNGGLMAGAVLTRRPDLFGAAWVGVGVLDMLRFHKFTIGWGWVSDYGSPDEPEEFRVLYSYSPYHNIRQGTRYPATLITTADHDDRVVPAHSFKFAAALQRAQAGEAPILLRTETRAGHGSGKPTSKQIEEATDGFAFLVRELGMTGSRTSLPAGPSAGDGTSDGKTAG
ncbi:MAG TPA: prolyl oligopeptidase family serine peptidase [Thermoanaerobaculia bacterium]|nr:prolyl oligopeptidase family serine peptidase [Thermoanaerobaculia bacterium]